MDNRAVGVFDSGLGGLTSVRELRRILPNEKIVFLGDTLRIPYGTRDRETLHVFAEDDFRFLLSRDVKYIIIACGTVSSNIAAEQLSAVPVPVTGVIKPAAEAAAASSSNGIIGVIATSAAVQSRAYEEKLKDLDPSFRVVSVPCPKLVPLIEAEASEDVGTALDEALKEYLLPIRDAGADTLILGCTHYPLVSERISSFLGDSVTLIDSGAEAARAARDEMSALDLLSSGSGPEVPEFFVTSAPERFAEAAEHFLGERFSHADLVYI
ncbi:MAG: glutamate racemase [Oscillospiraceae bacterium]|nr:glutamate racemase [Oscillospiraceae bacterium]